MEKARIGAGAGEPEPSAHPSHREMSLVNVWYEGWMVGARPPLGGCIIASPPISFRSVASSRARTGSTSGALTRGMRFRAAGGLGRRARLCFAQEHCSCSQKNQGTFRQFHFVSEFTETASRAFGSHFHFSESAFVRNCDARVHSLDTYTEPSLLAANTDAGELRWCKHEEGLMILIQPMDGSPPQLPHREEKTPS